MWLGVSDVLNELHSVCNACSVVISAYIAYLTVCGRDMGVLIIYCELCSLWYVVSKGGGVGQQLRFRFFEVHQLYAVMVVLW